MTFLDYACCFYIALAVVGTLIDTIAIANYQSCKVNTLISVKAFRAVNPDFNTFGVICVFVFLSIISPLYGLLRLFYNLFTWHPKGKNNNGN